MRVRKSFERREGVKIPKLVVVAAEGRKTEKIYIEALRDERCASGVQVKVLEREENESSPDKVLGQLRAFKEEYKTEDYDELWVVVDRDRWEERMLSEVAQACENDKIMHFCLSNPCFELWLLLHLEDISTYTPDKMVKLKENKRAGKNSDTWLKKRVRKLMGQYSESKYDAPALVKSVQHAITRARNLDVNPKDRWPQTVGTRVYLLAESIMREK